uniref:Kit ligand n=1 Tax=Takifugu rubripes TaxID=31033 RepID=A0A3B5KH73_TAKRU
HMRKNVSIRICFVRLTSPTCDSFAHRQQIWDANLSQTVLQKQNVPSDYEIPVSSIPKDVAGTCWVVLNIYPLEQSLRNLAGMFGAVSSNREQISVFISMLKTAMQLFQCHYRERGLMSGLYFDYIKDILHAASQGTSGLPCKPPPCLNQHPSPGGQEEGRGSSWSIRAPWILVLIPFTACAVILLWLVRK